MTGPHIYRMHTNHSPFSKDKFDNYIQLVHVKFVLLFTHIIESLFALLLFLGLSPQFFIIFILIIGWWMLPKNIAYKTKVMILRVYMLF